MGKNFEISRLREGDKSAFKDFFNVLYPRLMALACRFVEDYVAKDIVQDVFATYWEKRENIEPEHVLPFFYKWTQNRCLNHIKHQMVVADYEARIRIAERRLEFLNQKTDTNDLFKEIIQHDLNDLLEASIKKLPPKCAQVFRMCYFQEMSHKEIAKEMNISHRTVEGHIRQAVLFLRKDLRELSTFLSILL